MNRRTFAQTVAATALAAVAPKLPAASLAPAPAPQYGLSVMLWTVFKDLPFEERMAKVVESGYNKIQLVGEYRNWKQADYDRANEARKRLGVEFDTSAGLAHAVGNPADRDAFLADLKEAIDGPMTRLDIPAMIVMSGNVVPGLTREAQHASCIEGLKQAAKLVEGKTTNGQPVRLLLECIHLEENPHYFLTSANEAIEIIRAVNHPQVQFLYDMYHEQMSYGDLISKLDKHLDVIGLIHVADVPGRHQPGTGELNYGNIYKKLAELNYKHNIAMEFIPTTDPVGTLRAAKALALNPGSV